jgi:cold shock CspA family protein
MGERRPRNQQQQQQQQLSFQPFQNLPPQQERPQQQQQQQQQQERFYQQQQSPFQPNASSGSQPRLQGLVEKVKDSYGFICIMEGEGNVFFHFTSCNFNTRQLQVGDCVDYVLGKDTRSNRDVAVDVRLLPPGTVSPHVTSEVVQGVVHAAPGGREGENDGQISCEVHGRSRRVPFAVQDQTNPAQLLRKGDRVSLRTRYDRVSHTTRGIEVTQLERVNIKEADGVVKSVKDGFGFLERADVDQEIFFHFSEVPPDLRPAVGDAFRFEVSTRRDKPIALNLRPLTPGSVVIEDTLPDTMRGHVDVPLAKPRSEYGPPRGTIQFQSSPANASDATGSTDASAAAAAAGSSAAFEELYFYEYDIAPDSKVDAYHLRQGDIVEFRITCDRRNGRRRATSVRFISEAAHDQDLREMGVICTLRDGFGFIKCADRDARVFFHYSELLDQQSDPALGSEVEFTVQQGDNDKANAVRVKLLPRGSVQFETVSESRNQGIVVQLPFRPDRRLSSSNAGVNGGSGGNGGGNSGNSNSNNSGNSNNSNSNAGGLAPLLTAAASSSSSTSTREQQLTAREKQDVSERGLIECEIDGEKQTIGFRERDVRDMRISLQIGDLVDFRVQTVRRSRASWAVQVELISRSKTSSGSSHTAAGAPAPVVEGRQRGVISDLKESYGFIESEDGTRETFFHYNDVQGNASDLHLLDVVSYEVVAQADKVRAKNVYRLNPESLTTVEVLDEAVISGVVARPLISDNHYGGRISFKQASPAGSAADEESSSSVTLPFGITSLQDPSYVLKAGEEIKFRVATNIKTNEQRAVHIKPLSVRSEGSRRLVAQVESLKGEYGFLAYRTDERDNLFFHTSNVTDGEELGVGDEVEFSISYNARTQKYRASDIKLLTRAPPSQQQQQQQQQQQSQQQQQQQQPQQQMSQQQLLLLLDQTPPTPRPANLIRRRESSSSCVMRQPFGPDGSTGFKTPRNSTASLDLSAVMLASTLGPLEEKPE